MGRRGRPEEPKVKLDVDAIKSIMKEKHLSIRQIGRDDTIDISEKTIQRAFASGKATDFVLWQMAKYFNVDPSSLLEGMGPGFYYIKEEKKEMTKHPRAFNAYLYDSLREVVWPGRVVVHDENFTYKTVHCRFVGENHSFLVSENEGEFYRGVFWLRERDDDKANMLYSQNRLEKADELEAEYERLISKMQEIQNKIDDARTVKEIHYKFGGNK